MVHRVRIMKFKPRITSRESRATKKAFTLIELVVSITLLTMVISFASVIFNVSIDAHRTSAASAEIMQKFRAITDQLNRDFKGLQKDAPLLIWFRNDANFIENNRFDQIMFFAAGDFQSTQLYNGSPLVGNVARIHYSQAQSRDPFYGNMKKPWEIDDERQRLLARRRHILSADTALVQWPVAADIQTSFDCISGSGNLNEVYEYDRLSLARWKTIPIDEYGIVVNTCFYKRPEIDKQDPDTFHKLMCEGIGSFAIQWAYPYPVVAPSEFRWFPETPHFDQWLTHPDWFGVYFNILNPSLIDTSPWYFVKDVSYAEIPVVKNFESGFYPRALKFTFMLYDSKGIIKNGREFTHIVYLDN